MATEYITLQEALEEAGLHHVELGVRANGAVDGSNKLFSVDHKPLTDTNYNDTVSWSDVQAYVDGTPVEVSEVNEQFGTFELVKAPASGTVVTVDYAYAPVPLSYVKKLRAAATAWINRNMTPVDPCAPYGREGREVPGAVAELCRNYVAARLLIREYGYNQDIEGTSKDGYKRLSAVKADMQEYRQSGGECGDMQGVGSIDGLYSSSSSDLFGEFDARSRCGDDCFERGF